MVGGYAKHVLRSGRDLSVYMYVGICFRVHIQDTLYDLSFVVSLHVSLLSKYVKICGWLLVCMCNTLLILGSA